MFKTTAKIILTILICLLLLAGCSLRDIITGANPESPAEDLVFTTTRRIHPDMPNFTFHRIIGGESDYAIWPNEREVEIVIIDAYGNLVQEITGLVQGAISESYDDDEYALGFLDFNFDGYLDMYMVRRRNPTHPWFLTRYFWLWDAEAGQFVANEQLSDFASVSEFRVRSATQQIETWRHISHIHQIREFREYHDGEFVLVASENHWGESREYWEITHTDHLTGEVTEWIQTFDGEIIAADPQDVIPGADPESPMGNDDNIFTTTGRIHPSMPPFTFHRIISDDYVMQYERGSFRDVTIIIEDFYGNVVQEITGLMQATMWDEWDDFGEEWYEITLLDFNFDGYMDMMLAQTRPQGTGQFIERYFWLWDIELGQFVPNEHLVEIASVARFGINEETQQIEVLHRMRAWEHMFVAFEYQGDGEFASVTTRHYDGWGWYFNVTHTDLLTGETRIEIAPHYEDNVDNPPDEIIMKRIQVHPDMMPIIVRLDIWARGEWWDNHTIDVTVRWDDEEGALIQEMFGLVAYGSPIHGRPWLMFEDYNQDGYMDMAVHRAPGGSMRNMPHFFWLWDAELEKFVTNELLEHISDWGSVFITDEGRVRNFHRVSGSFFGFTEYEYHAKEGFVAVFSHVTEYLREGDEREILIREDTKIDHITGIETITREQINP